MPLRLRRGTDAERLSITPAVGEPIYTTDTKKLYIGDGTTTGGIEVTSESSGGGLVDVISDTTPQLGGDLDLNANNIVGTGNINIDGTITATGNINLGDSTEDSLNLTGLINSNVTPSTNELYNIGSDTLRWNNIYGTNVFGDVNGNLVSNDSTILVNSLTKDIISRDIIATGTITGLLEGDVQGSLIAEDSTVIFNSTTKDFIIGKVVSDLPNDADLESPINFGEEGGATTSLRVFSGKGDGLHINGFLNTLGTAPVIRVFSAREGAGGEKETLQIGDQTTALIAEAYDGTSYQGVGAVGTFISGINGNSGELEGGAGFIIPKPETNGTEFQEFTALADGSFNSPVSVNSPEVKTDALYTQDGNTQITDSSGNIVNLAFTGETGNTPVDTGTVDTWLEVSVNGTTKYIPLYA